jgi:hypothetical protein
VADAITQASQSNISLSPIKSNNASKHDVGVRRDNDNSDMEISSSTSLGHSTYAAAIASAEVLHNMIQQSKAAGQARYFLVLIAPC